MKVARKHAAANGDAEECTRLSVYSIFVALSPLSTGQSTVGHGIASDISVYVQQSTGGQQ